MTKLDDAVSVIKSGDNVYVHAASCAPQTLISGLVKRASELKGVNIYHLHTEGKAPYANESLSGSFNVNCFFIGQNVRECVQEGRGSYIPIFLSEVPSLFRNKVIKLDVVLISVSPPDKHGFCSLGLSVEATKAAIESAKIVIAQVNSHMPRTHGDGLIHVRDINKMIYADDPIIENHPANLTEIELSIGRHVAALIEDGSTLQMGIGSIPNAVLACLGNHKNLGVHTEMFSDGILPLVESGVINGRMKKIHTGKIISTFVMGTRKIYDFVDDNPQVLLLDCAFVNDTHIIRKNPKMIAINSAIEIDLSGQVCADSIGKNMYSGVGGQMDFIRGATLSEGGKPIIALPSVTNKGFSRIVPFLKIGAGVVTTRAHIQYVVTEYGVANLYGKSLRQRAKELIRIAHPDHQAIMEEQAYYL